MRGEKRMHVAGELQALGSSPLARGKVESEEYHVDG